MKKNSFESFCMLLFSNRVYSINKCKFNIKHIRSYHDGGWWDFARRVLEPINCTLEPGFAFFHVRWVNSTSHCHAVLTNCQWFRHGPIAIQTSMRHRWSLSVRLRKQFLYEQCTLDMSIKITFELTNYVQLPNDSCGESALPNWD